MTGTPAQLRPPAFVDRKALARELCCGESTINEYVSRGILPPPVISLHGFTRWDWAEVEMILRSNRATACGGGDPYLRGVRNAAQASKGGGDAA